MDEQFPPVSAAGPDRTGSGRVGAARGVSLPGPAPAAGQGAVPDPGGALGWEVRVCACPGVGGARVCVSSRGALRGLYLTQGGTGVCACPRGVLCQTAITRPGQLGDSSPSTLITLIFPPVTQCLDGIDYDDFSFGSHMMEQKEPLMETGKGPSGCALLGVPSCSGVSQQVDSCLLVPRSTAGFVHTGPTVGCQGIPAPCHEDGACSIWPCCSVYQGLPGWAVTSWGSLFPK